MDIQEFAVSLDNDARLEVEMSIMNMERYNEAIEANKVQGRWVTYFSMDAICWMIENDPELSAIWSTTPTTVRYKQLMSWAQGYHHAQPMDERPGR